ncbi:MAG: alcohol dehydrogenase catalytic domain-containing protein [Kiritimatiellae bacterium]|jgi:L-iditol 2-dehydrogenase|nr:alcohol dehydrogenase catalytic domain-containing protein [Kiritimatiellia bacterium]
MRAIALTNIRKVEILEQPEPIIQTPHDVLLHVDAVGMCGSDIHYYSTGRIGSQVVKYPFVVGHEFGATVLAIGDAVRRVRIGDHVAVDPAMPCFACAQCLAGRTHTCRHLTFLGCPGQAAGCLCEQVVMPETSCFPVPSSFSAEDAALIEPLSIGCYAVKLSGLTQKSRILIQGSGPIGLSVLLAARQAGAEYIAVSEPIAERRECAISMDADWAGTPDELEDHLNKSDPLEINMVFECCGKQEAMDQAVALLAPGGKLMLIGIPTFDRPNFAIDQLRRKELCIQNVRRQNECVNDAIRLLEQRPKTRLMITHRLNANQTGQAFKMVEGYQDGVIKAIIQF